MLDSLQKGNIFAEYAMILVLISAVAVVAVSNTGATVNDIYENINTNLPISTHFMKYF